MTGRAIARGGALGSAVMLLALSSIPTLAQATTAPPKIDAADPAWMISATAFVLMMSIPGLALFYCGMVRKKNVLATMAQTLISVCIGSLLLAFSGEGSFIGTLDRALLRGIGMSTTSPLAGTIPELLFMAYQMTFAVIAV